MKGLVLKSCNQIIYATNKNKGVGIIISNKEGEYRITLNAMDEKGTSYIWLSKEINVGDSFIVKYDDIEESMETPSIEIRNPNNEEENNRLLLETYHKLKTELTNEGVL